MTDVRFWKRKKLKKRKNTDPHGWSKDALALGCSATGSDESSSMERGNGLSNFYKIHHLQIPFYRYRMHSHNKTKSKEYHETVVG